MEKLRTYNKQKQNIEIELVKKTIRKEINDCGEKRKNLCTKNIILQYNKNLGVDFPNDLSQHQSICYSYMKLYIIK